MRRALLLGLVLSGCTDWSDPRTEPAVVEFVSLRAATAIPYKTGNFNGAGDISKQIPFIAGSTEDYYGLVFHCMHGRFAVGSNLERDKLLWQTWGAGQKVIITYREDLKNPEHRDFLGITPGVPQ